MELHEECRTQSTHYMRETVSFINVSVHSTHKEGLPFACVSFVSVFYVLACTGLH